MAFAFFVAFVVKGMIYLDGQSLTLDDLASIAHELQHALEALGNPNVRTAFGLSSFFHQLVPRRRDFDRLERRQLFRGNEQPDAAGLPGLPLNEAALMKRHDHAMDRGRRDAEEILKVMFRRRPTVQGDIRVDEGQVLALSRGEGDRHAVRSVIRCLAEGPRCTYDTASNWTRANVSSWKQWSLEARTPCGG